MVQGLKVLRGWFTAIRRNRRWGLKGGSALVEWPDGKRFAFTIVDDTDGATVENVGPLYRHLYEREMLTTKTVWPLAPTREPLFPGSGTLQDDDYRAWILELKAQGFEIAFHGATDHTSPREDTLRALDLFRAVIGHDPVMHINHVGQGESMYWGAARLDGLPRQIYRAVNTVMRRDRSFGGHVPGTELFWGDLCSERTRYVRNFVFEEIDTLACDPQMPYHDDRRPYVPLWFSASSAPEYQAFCEMLSEDNQDRLEASGGACILYSHLAFGFMENGRLKPRFIELIDRLASKSGWFVPASTLLDHLAAQPGWRPEVDRRALGRMQRHWLLDRLRHGTA